MVKVLYKRDRRVADRTVKCYLSLDCNLNCSYCSADIPQVSKERKTHILAPDVWTEGINRRNRSCLLAGGEPFLYPYLAELVNMIRPDIRIEIYSNLVADVKPFLEAVKKQLTFLISCHPMTAIQQVGWRNNVGELIDAGFAVRFHVIKTKGWQSRIAFIREHFENRITLCDDQRSYPKSRMENRAKKVTCKGRVYIYGPQGYRYSCARLMGLGTSHGRYEHISQPDGNDWLEVQCNYFGTCAGCDNLIEGTVTCE